MKRVVAEGRQGLASIWAVIILSAMTVMLAAVTAQMLQTRKVLDQRQHQVQAGWLARSGLELAAERLLANPAGYDGETVELLPLSQVKIKVSKGDKPDLFVVNSEANYPVDRKDKVVLTLTRRFQRSVDKGQAKLTVVPE